MPEQARAEGDDVSPDVRTGEKQRRLLCAVCGPLPCAVGFSPSFFSFRVPLPHAPPSRPAAAELRLCRRKAAKTPVIKATRRAATQLEFTISPSAYDEARSAARRMHDLLSDGHETWRDWQARDAGRREYPCPCPAKLLRPWISSNSPDAALSNFCSASDPRITLCRDSPHCAPSQGPERDLDGAWGFVGEGSHALTAAILMYRTGWRAHMHHFNHSSKHARIALRAHV